MFISVLSAMLWFGDLCYVVVVICVCCVCLCDCVLYIFVFGIVCNTLCEFHVFIVWCSSCVVYHTRCVVFCIWLSVLFMFPCGSYISRFRVAICCMRLVYLIAFCVCVLITMRVCVFSVCIFHASCVCCAFVCNRSFLDVIFVLKNEC